MVFGLGTGHEAIWCSGSIVAMKKEELRAKIRDDREREWIRDALRARTFSSIETFEQGLKLIDFALGITANAKHA